MGVKGDVTVIPDRSCPVGTAYLLDESKWFLVSKGMHIVVDDLDGQTMRLNSTADQYDIRLVSYAQLGCTAPSHNARITW